MDVSLDSLSRMIMFVCNGCQFSWFSNFQLRDHWKLYRVCAVNLAFCSSHLAVLRHYHFFQTSIWKQPKWRQWHLKENWLATVYNLDKWYKQNQTAKSNSAPLVLSVYYYMIKHHQVLCFLLQWDLGKQRHLDHVPNISAIWAKYFFVCSN